MYIVIIIIISFEEDINRSFLELRLALKSPELELNSLELELELKLIVSSGIGIEYNRIGIALKKNGIDLNPGLGFSSFSYKASVPKISLSLRGTRLTLKVLQSKFDKQLSSNALELPVKRCHEALKSRDWTWKLSNRFEIWEAAWHQCCQSACQISKRLEYFKTILHLWSFTKS